MRVGLLQMAQARSGDKGDTANIGLIALRSELYPVLVKEVMCERVKHDFKGVCQGPVECCELPGELAHLVDGKDPEGTPRVPVGG